MKKVLLALLLLLVHSELIQTLSAQNRPDTLSYKRFEASPRASALLRMGEYSVSHYTGLPDIDIPFYTISTDWCEVPVSFHYRGGGIKYDDISGELGLGWDLAAGGVITQEIRGMDDLGDDTQSWVRRADQVDQINVLGPYSDYSFIRAIERGDRGTLEDRDIGFMLDGEHDIFRYSCPGGSGQFIIPKNGAIQRTDRAFGNPLFIPVNGWKAYASSMQISLTDTQGRIYTFSRLFSGANNEYNSKVHEFFLTSITRPGGSESITFSYTSGDYAQNYTKKPAIIYSQTLSEIFPSTVDFNCCSMHQGPHRSEHGFVTELRVTTPRLDRISFRGGYIQFVYAQPGPGSSATMTWDLRRVELYNVSGRLVRKATLTKEGVYGTTEASALGYHEVFLRKVEIGDSADCLSWTMDYYCDHLPVSVIPIVTASPYRGVDYWGYFTGRQLNGFCYSPSIVPVTHSSERRLDRSPVESWTKAGVLTCITYQSGGKTEFEWEPNRCGSFVCGGLRIKEIRGYDRDGSLLEKKRYEYESARIRSVPVSQDFVEETSTLHTRYHTGDPAYDMTHLCCIISRKTVLPFPRRDLTIDGHPVVYPCVAEYSGTDSSSEVLSRYSYTFTPDPDFTWSASSYPTCRAFAQDRVDSDYSWLRGRPSSRIDYKRRNGEWIPVRTLLSTWQIRDSVSVLNLRSSRAVQFSYEDAVDDNTDECANFRTSPSWYKAYYQTSGNATPYNWFNYRLTTGWLDMVRTEESLDSVTVRTDYTYNDACLPVEKQVSCSDGSTLLTRTDYVFERQSEYPEMYAQNRVGDMVEEKTWRDTTLLTSTLTTWSNLLGTPSGLWVPKSYKEQGHTGLSTESSGLGNVCIKDIVFREYDAYGNILDMFDGRLRRAFVWSYGNTLPCIMAEGASYNDLVSAAGSSMLSFVSNSNYGTDLDTLASTLRNSLGTSLVRLNKYEPLVGTSGITDPSGRRTWFEYDALGRLSQITDEDYNPIESYAYSESLGRLTKYTYTSPMGGSCFSDVQWHDGLGRPMQEIAREADFLFGRDVVSMTSYNQNGLPCRRSVPVALGSGGVRKDSSAVMSALAARWNDSRPFEETVYEPSPLGRPIASFMPGDSLAGHPSRFVYGPSRSGEVLIAHVSDEGTLVWSSTDAAGRFHKVRTTDGDGRVTEVFTDMQGRTVLQRALYASGPDTLRADTYHFYDLAGRERWAVSPEGSKVLVPGQHFDENSPAVKNFAHVYRYDDANRLIASRKPGCGWTEYFYNSRSLLIGERDAAAKAAGRITMIHYDALGRETWRGFKNGTASWDQELVQLNAESYSTEQIFTDYGGKILSRTFFDSVPPAGMDYYLEYSAPAQSWGEPDTRLKGLVTYREQALLEGSGDIVRYIQERPYYDARGRVIQTAQVNQFGEPNRFSTRYDFAGRVIQTHDYVEYNTGSTACDLMTTYTRDSRGRVISSASSFLGSEGSLRYSYDEGDRPVSILYGGSPAQTGNTIASESRSYNIQGWLTDKRLTQGADTLLHDRLGYYGPDGGSTPSFVGRITRWSMLCPQGESRYDISYDALGRFAGAGQYISGAPDDRDTERNVSWDSSCNILSRTLYRGGTAMPQQFYYWDGKLSLTTYSPAGYSYNAAGYVTADGLRDMPIYNNVLNKPSLFDNWGQSSVGFSYAADGTKLETQYPDGTSLTRIGPASMRDDGNGQIYTEGTDAPFGRFVSPSELAPGRTGDYVPLYYITDHLGSTRLILDGTDGSILEQAHFTPMGRRWTSDSTTLASNKFRYGGKEELPEPQGIYNYWDDSHTLDFGARLFEPFTAHWLAPDPLSDKYPNISPYTFCAGDPVNFMDPDGRDDYFINSNGTWTQTETSDPYDRIFGNSGTRMIVKNKKIFENFEEYSDEMRWGQDATIPISIRFTVINNDEPGELLEIFKFLSNNTNIEWDYVSAENGSLILATEFLTDKFQHSKLSKALAKSKHPISYKQPIFKIHNHIRPYETEVKSMAVDAANFKSHPETQSFVYFNETGNVYIMTLKGPKLFTKW